MCEEKITYPVTEKQAIYRRYLWEPADGPNDAAVRADLRHIAEVHDVGASGEGLRDVDRLLATGPGLLYHNLET